ncbi:polysaccharide deacetylase family protein [Streptococcus uberis]|nr:polysaccharide deacetylase family protein [Streptococcus uberis]MCK1203138.1 polysaccharide deacetylase family protein [Streptococcus uberis]
MSLYQNENDQKELIIIKPYLTNTPLRGIKKVSIHKVVYQEGIFSLKKKSDKIISHYHVKEDYSPLNLGDVISGDLNVLKAIIKEVDSSFSTDHIESQNRTELKGILTDGLAFADQELIINQKIHLPYQKLYDITNATYLSETLKNDYDHYMAQKKKQLEGQKQVALTFDDGPDPRTTPQVLDMLKKYHAKATFFMLGGKISGNESLVKRIADEGNEVGNHSFDHSNFTKLSHEQIVSQIESTNSLIEKACGKKPFYFRPPYGATDERVKQAVGMSQLLWTVDTKDWENHNTAAIMTNIKNQLRPNGIILMHDIHQTSVNALPTVLDYLVNQGYHFVTVSQLMASQNIQ